MSHDQLAVGDWIKYDITGQSNREGIILSMGHDSCTVQSIDLNVNHTGTDVVKYECVHNILSFSYNEPDMTGCVRALCKI